jgi:uncharacterized membrane protein YdjX (TVP38/TMEM64 family)
MPNSLAFHRNFMRDSDRSGLAGTNPPKTGDVLGIISLLIMLALGLAFFFPPLQDWLRQGQTIKAQLVGFGFAAPLVFVAGTALLMVVGVPRLVLCSFAGAAFGPFWGLVWSQLGTLLGAYGTFLTVRTCGRTSILRRYPQLDRYSCRIRKRGLLTVLLIRQLPMNSFHNNLLLGLSPVEHRDFLLGSLLGYLPLGLTAVLIGAGMVQTDLTRLVQYLAAGITVFFMLGFLLKRLSGPSVQSTTENQ